MKVYISYSHRDKEFAHHLVEELKKNKIDVWIDDFEINVGDNIINMINQGIDESDFIITILSKAYVKSEWTLRELNAFAIKELSADTNQILPILLEDCEIPGLLRDKLYLDFRYEFEAPFNQLLRKLKRQPSTRSKRRPSKKQIQAQNESALNYQIKVLRDNYTKGELTLFLGAGVSMNAGVPCWDDLLKYLLSNLFTKKLEFYESNVGIEDKLAELYHKNFNTSPLMIAQYLKNGLGNDFLNYVRIGLYNYEPKSSKLIDVITELARPQRSRESLNSIVTFNFDDLIEKNLKKNHIQYKSIFKEGQRSEISELPIYHVHGFLPSTADLTTDNEIVFSEDAYHSQFIDSFSWSNLIQLNQLSQTVCVFVGLSMTDPNLRRLLDVSMRKNPERRANHFVFKLRYNQQEIDKEINKLGIIDKNRDNARNFIKIVEILEEQDANNLGLNVIWISDYNEIPTILMNLI